MAQLTHQEAASAPARYGAPQPFTRRAAGQEPPQRSRARILAMFCRSVKTADLSAAVERGFTLDELLQLAAAARAELDAASRGGAA